jgi:hypothetical protein
MVLSEYEMTDAFITTTVPSLASLIRLLTLTSLSSQALVKATVSTEQDRTVSVLPSLNMRVEADS